MTDLLKAYEILQEGHTAVLVKGEDVIITDERGVAPLVKWNSEDKSFEGYSAADKVIGKAAAFFYVTFGIKKVRANVLSKFAADVFEKYGIEYWYDTLADEIINRTGDGLCPMESAVMGCDSVEDGVAAIIEKLFFK